MQPIFIFIPYVICVVLIIKYENEKSKREAKEQRLKDVWGIYERDYQDRLADEVKFTKQIQELTYKVIESNSKIDDLKNDTNVKVIDRTKRLKTKLDYQVRFTEACQREMQRLEEELRIANSKTGAANAMYSQLKRHLEVYGRDYNVTEHLQEFLTKMWQMDVARNAFNNLSNNTNL